MFFSVLECYVGERNFMDTVKLAQAGESKHLDDMIVLWIIIKLKHIGR